MIVIISPSKTQDFSPLPSDLPNSQPRFLKESTLLVKEARKLSQEKLAQLMELSEKLSALNHGRFQQWQTPFSPENAKQALLAFKGDVYAGIEAERYTADELTYAQDHLRILSGLYGLLRPLDLIQPYRLEMKIKLKNPKGKDLYAFWADRLTNTLREDLKSDKNPVLINLASNEYYKALQPKNLEAPIITPVFKEFKNGKYSTIAIFAKKARGMMTDFILRERIEQAEKIKLFEREGYAYDDKLSKGNEWVFVR